MFYWLIILTERCEWELTVSKKGAHISNSITIHKVFPPTSITL